MKRRETVARRALDLGPVSSWAVARPGPLETAPLRRTQLHLGAPGPRDLLVKVSTCGVCRTDLHVVMGDLPQHRPSVVPGHEIVGVVEMAGAECTRFAAGDRVGVPWLRSTCGSCRFCLAGRENLCIAPRFTGWDDDGGYAEYAVAPEAYVYAIPDCFDDVAAAPLLCAGVIGFRALERAELPERGRLGLYGFGGSAHLTAQLALHRGHTVHVMTRSVEARRLALELGCTSASESDEMPPEPLDSAILFAPVGALVPTALAALDRGGTLAVAGIHLSDVPGLHYQAHLFQERQLRSVTANTRRDGERFFAEAEAAELDVRTVVYPFDEADRALTDLWEDRISGAAVLVVS